MKVLTDIIVIGGGNAGCALAHKLSRKFSVIVLEAGTNMSADPRISTPSASGTLIREVNTFFYPLGHSVDTSGSARQPFPAVEGELLGGGSSVNGMQYVTGTGAYYDNWAAQVQDAAWDAAHSAEAYRQIETVAAALPDRGTSGPVDIASVVLNEQAATLFAQATSDETGVPFDVDYNNWDFPLGSYVKYQVTQTPDSKRVSSYTAYLRSLLKPDVCNPDVYVSKCPKAVRIQVVTKARVQRILWEDVCCPDPCASGPSEIPAPRAVGALAVVNGVCVKFTARRAVILTAGFQSASLLQLSGVGDPDVLESRGVEVVIPNARVGRAVTNHPIVSVTGLVAPGTESPFTPLPPDYNDQGLYSGGAQIPNETGSRSFQLIGSASPVQVGVAPSAFTISGLVLDAKSQGQIQIGFSDPNRPPIFDFKYFSDPADVEQALLMYSRMYAILVRMGLAPTSPNPATQPAEATAYILSRFSQAYHWTGMVKMAASKAEGVVDSDGKVFGSQNLYVADISVAPFNPLGNTQALAYLIPYIIGEKLLASTC